MCMKTHICKLCGETNADVKFYAGMTSRCVECHKKSVRENRKQNVDHYRAYDAKRFQDDPRVKTRHKIYAASDAGKKASERSKRKWQAQNPDKRAAHVILGNAIKYGKIVKPKTCSRCGSSSRIHGHHSDYAKPLDVVWLCSKCHTDEHRTDDPCKP